MSSRFCVVLLIVKIFQNVSSLEELPHVEDNNILDTDTAVRDITNNIFSILKLKLNKEQQILKEYSLIHNYLVSTSLHDYTNLKQIAKLTRVDKTKLNNETKNFITIVNEILDEDVKNDTETEDEFIVRHIEGFLTNLDKYTHKYEYSENNVDVILAEILKILEKNETISEAYKNITLDKEDDEDSRLESSDENVTVTDGFWQPDTRRIFQGHKTKIKRFPFMASIQIFNHFQCAGSIIAKDLIITAATCLQLAWNNRFFRENPSFLSARVGSTFHNGGGERIEVLEVHFHPSYDPRTLTHNLCIIRLWRHINKKLKWIPIDRSANLLPENTDGITVIGWGARRQNNLIIDPFMAMAVLDIYPLKECQEIYSKEYVTTRHFCAGFLSKGGGACNRDIGGPGIVNHILTGVISFGSPTCGTPDSPTVFTKLGYYTHWIDSILERKVPHKKQRTTSKRPLEFTVPTVYEPIKTTFRITPLEMPTKKRRIVEEVETLRELRDQGLLKKFVDTVIGSHEAERLLKEANISESIIRNSRIVERIPFTYSPVTTLEPYAPSTAINFIGSDINYTDTNVRHDKHKLSEDESYESLEINQNDKDVDSDDNDDKQLNHKLEEDIVKIIEEIHLEDYVKKDKNKQATKKGETYGSKITDKILNPEANEKDIASASQEKREEHKDLLDGSIESGLDIPADAFSDLTYRNNASEDIVISKQELLKIVSEALKEELNKTTTTKTVTSTTKNVTTLNPTQTVTTTPAPSTHKTTTNKPTTDEVFTTKKYRKKHLRRKHRYY